MYKSGHLGMTLLLYSPVLFVLIEYSQPFLALLGFIIAVSFCSLPDIDFKLPNVKHRGYSHSLIGAFFFSIPIALIGFFAYTYLDFLLKSLEVESSVTPITVGMYCFVFGYYTMLTHYAGDIVTPSGIPILAPLSRTNYSLGLFYAKNTIANGLFLMLGIISTILVLVHDILLLFI